MFSLSEMSKSGTGSEGGGFKAGTHWQWCHAPESPGFGYILAGQRFPESKRAVIVMERPCASWIEDSCGLGAKQEK